MKLEIRKYKSIKGFDEGDPFNAELWVDGTRAAIVSYEGTGGPYHYVYASGPQKGGWWENSPEYKSLVHWIETLPEVDVCGMKIKPNLDCLVDEEVQKLKIRKLCAKRTVFQQPGEADWLSIREPFTTQIKAWVIAKYGPSVVFANETLAGQTAQG